MKIKINDDEYNVVFVDKDEKRMKIDGGIEVLGLTEYLIGRISIRKDMTDTVTKSTITHELIHAFIFSYGYHLDNEEAICDFFASHGNKIMELANQIIKEM